jgi:hypothetical protein
MRWTAPSVLLLLSGAALGCAPAESPDNASVVAEAAAGAAPSEHPPPEAFVGVPAYAGAYYVGETVSVMDTGCVTEHAYGIPAEHLAVRAFLLAQQGVSARYMQDDLAVLSVHSAGGDAAILLAPGDGPLRQCVDALRDRRHTCLLTRVGNY